MKTRLLVAAVLAVSLAAVLEPEPIPEPVGVTIVSAVIDARQDLGDRERVKMIVTLSDGTKRDYWPRVAKGQTDKALTDAAKASVQADLDAQAEAEDTAPIPRDEIERVTKKSWSEWQALAEAIE